MSEPQASPERWESIDRSMIYRMSSHMVYYSLLLSEGLSIWPICDPWIRKNAVPVIIYPVEKRSQVVNK